MTFDGQMRVEMIQGHESEIFNVNLCRLRRHL